jgi:hypothetical protein
MLEIAVPAARPRVLRMDVQVGMETHRRRSFHTPPVRPMMLAIYS